MNMLGVFIGLLFIVSVKSVDLDIVNFDEALGFWEQIVVSKPEMLGQLQQLLNENRHTSRKELIVKVGVWAKKSNNLQVTT